MAGIKGKQLADAPSGITSGKINDSAVITAKIADGALAASSAGRLKIASDFFDTATFDDKVADGAITLAVATDKVAAGAIVGAKIADAPNGIATGKINDLAVTGGKIADAPNGITTAKINDSQVTGAKIASAPNGVASGNINDSAVVTAKIAAGAISADADGRAKIAADFFDTATLDAKIADGAITLAVATDKVAAGAVVGAKIADAPNGITTAKINDSQVTGAKIASAPNGVASGNINDSAVITAKIADNALSADAAGRGKMQTDFFDTATLDAKIADGAITLAVATDKVAAGAIVGAKIADAPNGITNGKINDATIQGGKLADAPNGITNGKINDGTIQGAKLADAPNGITTAKINDSQVTGAKIASAPNGVASGNINDNAVTTAKINDGALSADAAGRAKIAASFFDAATVNAKFADTAIALAKLAEAVIQADGGQAFTAAQSMGGFRLTNLAAPAADGDAVNRQYVDERVQGLHVKQSCQLATIAALPAYTPSGSGVGKTITIDATGDLNVDGIKVLLNDRVLVKSEGASHADHGIYKCTTEGGVGVAAVLTRATDFDGSPAGEVEAGDFSFIEKGGTLADTGWVLTTNNPITVDTTALAFAQFSGAGSYTAGAGLLLTGGQFDIELAANPGLEFDAGGVGGKLRVLVAPNEGLQRTATGVGIDLDGDSMALGAGGVKASVPTASNKAAPPVNNCAADDSPTGLTITSTPGGNGMVNILVNGIKYELGQGSKLKDCYFSDGVGGARAIGAIQAGDPLYWNAVIAGFGLVNDGTDEVDMDYAVA